MMESGDLQYCVDDGFFFFLDKPQQQQQQKKGWYGNKGNEYKTCKTDTVPFKYKNVYDCEYKWVWLINYCTMGKISSAPSSSTFY